MDVMKRVKRMVDMTSGCWIWLRSVRRDGYPRMAFNGQARKVSQVVYETVYGARNGLHVLHSCDNSLCVNPAHLSLGTHQENMAQKHARRGVTGAAKQNADKVVCMRGHILAGENVTLYRGSRVCKECGRARARNYYRAKGESHVG